MRVGANDRFARVARLSIEAAIWAVRTFASSRRLKLMSEPSGPLQFQDGIVEDIGAGMQAPTNEGPRDAQATGLEAFPRMMMIEAAE